MSFRKSTKTAAGKTDKMVDSKVCEFLPWDTDFFGLRIGRVNQHHLTADSIRDILEWQKAHAIDCLYFLADFDDPETVQLAQAHDFQLVDIRVTLEWTLKIRNETHTDPAHRVTIRPFQTGDLPTLEAIAKISHTDTRFHFDQNFPRDKNDSLYATWIRRSCEGFADQVLVAEAGGQAVGYISCKLMNENEGQIGLLGVGEQARGQGVGKSLVYAALDWFAARNIQSVQVVTQGRNISAQRLYQNCGFMTHSVQLWYHKWASNPGSQAG